MWTTILANVEPVTVTTILLSGMGVLSAAVGHLYHSQLKMFAALQEKLNDCESDRLDLWKHISHLENK